MHARLPVLMTIICTLTLLVSAGCGGDDSPTDGGDDNTQPDSLDLAGYWGVRFISDTNADQENKGDVFQMIQNNGALMAITYCDQDTMIGTLTGDSLLFEDLNDSLVLAGTATEDSCWGTWEVEEEGETDTGRWTALRRASEPDQFDCVEMNADVAVAHCTDGRYVVFGQIDDHSHLVESATLSGDDIHGNFPLSDTIYAEKTDEWWTDLCDFSLVLSESGEPTWPKDYTIDIEFLDGHSRSVPLTVGGFYDTDDCPSCPEMDTVYLGCDYFPAETGDQWVYNTGTVTLEGSARTFTDGTGLRFEAELVFEDSTDLVFWNRLGQSVVLYGNYDYGAESFIDDPVEGLATVLLDSMRVGDRWAYLMLGSAETDSIYFELLDVVTVTVPAGTFENCLKIRMGLLGETPSDENYTDDYYFAPDVGFIKAERIAPFGETDGWFWLVNSGNRSAEMQSGHVLGVDYP